MNEEQLIEFINWLPTAVPEFQNASPEQIVQTLNQLYESEEGQATLSQFFTAFQESKNELQSQMFKKGGKLDQLTQKVKKGKKMCCKKKEIVQGGMVNKIAEKMQNGGKNNSTSKNPDSKATYSRNYDVYETTPAGDGLADVATILRPISNDQHEAIDRIISDNDFQGIGDTLYRRRLLNGPYLVPATSKPQYYLTPRDAAWQNGGYGTRKFEGLGTAPREWETLFKSFETPQMQNGGEFDNPIQRNATLSTLDVLNSTRPFIQQNVTPNETREFYAYSRDRLPDKVGGTGNFAGAIRTITPTDTTISYQLPGLAIYTAASSKDRGSRWKEINSKMDAIKNKANNQKNK